MIEAEFFAAQGNRPAPSGRALICAAAHAKQPQGRQASHKRNDARNRAPVSPSFSRECFAERLKGRFGGVKRGKGNHTVLFPPLAPRRGHGVPRPPKAATVHAHFERKVASSGKPLYRRKGLPSADGIVKGALRRSFLTSNAFRFIMKAKTKSRRYFYHGSF